ncbi:uncharacterized protein METZ01_LOCUS308600 [marine metagenome]|uniref:Uncharacterized protein n=1 Tax=marine metagenome TaxID=408172 RepID=A0A382N3T7_9ZZZZ
MDDFGKSHTGMLDVIFRYYGAFALLAPGKQDTQNKAHGVMTSKNLCMAIQAGPGV